MKIIFCSEPFSPLRVDSSYESEADAANKAGFEFDLIDYEALVNEENITTAIRKIVERSESETAIYRGWMLKPKTYEKLFETLASRKVDLINSSVEYQHCHYLPNSYSIIESITPKTISLRLNSEPNFD